MRTSRSTRSGPGSRFSRLGRRVVGGLPAVALVAGLGSSDVATAQRVEIEEFGSNPGNLRMWGYRPAGLATGAALVVALHGCRQSAAAYDDETGWVEVANRFGFALVFPEQKTHPWWGNNPLGCFNWFYRGDQVRDHGEALSIKQMTDTAIREWSLDPERVFITGLSAGGAMTAVMLAAYPETFAGGAIVAGIPYRCSRVPDYVPLASVSYAALWLGFTDPFACMEPGFDHAPHVWRERVWESGAPRPPRWPRVSIWHGTADRTVGARNAAELVDQWTGVHGTDARADHEQSIAGHLRREYHDAHGRPVVEWFLLDGMDHGVPINPAPAGVDPQPDQCGRATDYVLAAGICAAYHIARFWALTERR